MLKKMLPVTLLAGFALLIAAVGYSTARAAYESAEYKVIRSEGGFEIREYPDLMLVATSTKTDAQGRDGSFMKLFRYISGENESQAKIAMTTPVFMEDSAGDSTVQMGFVMPKEVVTAGVPAPTTPNVDIRKRTGGRFAVYRFSGRLDTKSAKEAETKLRDWMTENGLKAAHEKQVETAGYDAPFTPGPLRRNEVLIRLK